MSDYMSVRELKRQKESYVVTITRALILEERPLCYRFFFYLDYNILGCCWKAFNLFKTAKCVTVILFRVPQWFSLMD